MPQAVKAKLNSTNAPWLASGLPEIKDIPSVVVPESATPCSSVVLLVSDSASGSGSGGPDCGVGCGAGTDSAVGCGAGTSPGVGCVSAMNQFIGVFGGLVHLCKLFVLVLQDTNVSFAELT